MRRLMVAKIKLLPRLKILNVYYLVDYDFRGVHGQEPHPQYAGFYKEFEGEFGQSIRGFRSTNSVLILPSLEDAAKVKRIIEKHGGTANVRKCEKIIEH